MPDNQCNKTNMLKVVEAAESGRYLRTTNKFREVRDGKPCFCFNGLAIAVAIANGVQAEFCGDGNDPEDMVTARDIGSHGGNVSSPPPSVQMWLGITGQPYALPESVTEAGPTSYCNDVMDLSLPEIAAGVRTFYELGPKAAA